MRLALALCAALLLVGIALTGCASRQPSSYPWTTGFWFWDGSSLEREGFAGPVDTLFVHVGDIQRVESGPSAGQWSAVGSLAEPLPAAREYWLVWRYGTQAVPDLAAAPALAGEFARLGQVARERHLHVAGVQLDIDSPTRALPDYARFLQELRKALPQGAQISITALLDWFRPGTAVDGVIRQTDEFVPQFYDVQDRSSYSGGTGIAARIDAARWGPRFRRFGKRYRIGISTFGRARTVPPPGRLPQSSEGLVYFDVAPMELAASSDFELQASHNPAGELVLRYRAARPTRLGYNNFEPGEAVEFVLAGADSVRASVESARSMGGSIAGVVFFRWPGSEDALTMQPDDALSAAGAPVPGAVRRPRLDAVSGRCAAVECVDLYLLGASIFSPQPLRYAIRTSAALEYFVPERGVAVRMAGPSRLEVSLPAYWSRTRLYLGRAVLESHSEFEVQEQP